MLRFVRTIGCFLGWHDWTSFYSGHKVDKASFKFRYCRHCGEYQSFNP